MWTRIGCLSLMLLALSGCGSEDYTAVEKNRSELFPGFESYAAWEDVKSSLPPDVEAKVAEDTTLGQGKSAPPYKAYAVSLSPYSHLELRGRLLITFFNDRLMTTAFYPDNLDDYLAALRKSGVAVEFSQELSRNNTMIWIGTDFDHKQYVGWADKRLRDQQRRWLANYQ